MGLVLSQPQNAAPRVVKAVGSLDETGNPKVESTKAILSPVTPTELSLPSQPGDREAEVGAALLGMLHSEKGQGHRGLNQVSGEGAQLSEKGSFAIRTRRFLRECQHAFRGGTADENTGIPGDGCVNS